MDFRKTQNVSNEILRSFSVTEVYIRRGKRNLARKRKADWARNYDLETLMAKNNWATIEEMETVIPFHLPRFKKVIESCKTKEKNIHPSDLTFATRFITTFLFLRVKCTRPMTFQYLTIDMFQKCKLDNGFVDQRSFKTAKTFLFDSLLFDEHSMKIVDLYIDYCRPLLNPKCDYILITSAGSMCNNLCYSMTIMVHSAIQKYINPTRYRQIVETASCDLLSPEEQDIISKDQKHSSEVAKTYYQKKQSREIARKGKGAMEKLTGNSRVETNGAIATILSDIDKVQSNFDLSFLPKEVVNLVDTPIQEKETVNLCEDENENEDINLQNKVSDIISNDREDVKIEDQPISSKLIRFSNKEDECLKLGIKKYGTSSWASIIGDKNFQFHSTRTRDALRVRAGSMTFKKKFGLV